MLFIATFILGVIFGIALFIGKDPKNLKTDGALIMQHSKEGRISFVLRLSNSPEELEKMKCIILEVRSGDETME